MLFNNIRGAPLAAEPYSSLTDTHTHTKKKKKKKKKRSVKLSLEDNRGMHISKFTTEPSTMNNIDERETER